MSEWFWYAIAAAVLYGLHQVFTKLASQHIGDGVGGFVVELTAALIIALYLVYLKFFGEWKQAVTLRGLFSSHGNMRRRRHGNLLLTIPKGRAAFCCPNGLSRRRCVDGCSWNSLLS
jgi:drug/metabolite transporter (DMT)-like permease